MIFVLLTSIMTMLYPWNVEVGSYLTAGEWTNGRTYQAQSGYIGIDRWKKDHVRARAHHLRIDGDWYEQWTASVSAFHWWTDELKYGLDGGLVFGDRSAWFAGPKVEGVLGWIGYHGSYQYLSLENPVPMSDISWAGHSHTTTFLLRHQFGPYLVSIGALGSQLEYTDLTWNPMFQVSGWISERVFINLSHGFGKAQFFFHPITQTVDLYKGTTVAWYEVLTTIRLSPHVYTHFQYSRTDYESALNTLWPYTAHYVTAGLNLRY